MKANVRKVQWDNRVGLSFYLLLGRKSVYYVQIKGVRNEGKGGGDADINYQT
jgi:hypothetical protein